jgi:hypothetical protein
VYRRVLCDPVADGENVDTLLCADADNRNVDCVDELRSGAIGIDVNSCQTAADTRINAENVDDPLLRRLDLLAQCELAQIIDRRLRPVRASEDCPGIVFQQLEPGRARQ